MFPPRSLCTNGSTPDICSLGYDLVSIMVSFCSVLINNKVDHFYFTLATVVSFLRNVYSHLLSIYFIYINFYLSNSDTFQDPQWMSETLSFYYFVFGYRESNSGP